MKTKENQYANVSALSGGGEEEVIIDTNTASKTYMEQLLNKILEDFVD